jgi:hypothetical protein
MFENSGNFGARPDSSNIMDCWLDVHFQDIWPYRVYFGIYVFYWHSIDIILQMWSGKICEVKVILCRKITLCTSEWFSKRILHSQTEVYDSTSQIPTSQRFNHVRLKPTILIKLVDQSVRLLLTSKGQESIHVHDYPVDRGDLAKRCPTFEIKHITMIKGQTPPPDCTPTDSSRASPATWDYFSIQDSDHDFWTPPSCRPDRDEWSTAGLVGPTSLAQMHQQSAQAMASRFLFSPRLVVWRRLG